MSEPQTSSTKSRKRSRRAGPNVSEVGSRDARKTAQLVLEVLAGVRTPTEAAKDLGVSTTRYYGLETQALEGLVQACEPRDRGPRKRPDKRIAELEQQVASLEKECARRQALLRVAQRAVGVSAPASSKRKASGKKAEVKRTPGKRKPKRPTVRALRAAKSLESSAEPTGGMTSE